MAIAQRVWAGSLYFAVFLAFAHALPNIVSVADLHGDYERAVQILQAAGLMDKSTGAWSGGTTTLVQTGDIVDRGPESLKIYKLFDRLAAEAAKQGGEVVNLLGNHELMNIQGDFRYVNNEEMRSIGGTSHWQDLWEPEGEIGQIVRKYKVAAKVGSVLFVHAGLLPSFLQNGRTLEDLDHDMSSALTQNGRPEQNILENVVGDAGPLWTRFYAKKTSQEICRTLSKVLEQVGAQRMVVGHTPQERRVGEFRVNAVCGGSLILADTAISRAYNGEMAFIRYNAANEAVVHYPALGIEKVLPRPSLSRKQNLRTPTHAMAPASTSEVTAMPLQSQQTNEVPGFHLSVKLAEISHSKVQLSVMCSLVLAIIFLVRSWFHRRKLP